MSGHADKWKERIDEATGEGNDVLDLYNCEMGKEGRMEYLSEFLKDNKTVKVLHLDDNEVGIEGLQYLSEGLQVNQTLQELYLDDNKIDDDRLRYLCEGLKVNQTMKLLNLSGNQIGDQGLQHLTGAIRVNTSLLTVWIFNNAASDDAFIAFETALADIPARQAAREEYLSQLASRTVKSAAKR